VFRLGDGDGVDVESLITIDGEPCCLTIDRGGACCFVVASTEVLDIDAAVPPGVQPIDQFLQFVPFLAYLRRTFGSECWSNPQPAACLIIDDPLLRRRYGFLDFERLDSRLERSPFAMNVAFIPWNYRRTDRRVAERFKRPDRRFSISVHGCDHTEAEFGSCDERWLRGQARRALLRMDAHERLTGIKHNRVMVFPQGVFSKASLKALGEEGFIAAINSTIYPVDAAPGEIRFSDFLALAVTRFGGAPLFMRHYPSRLELLALDLFLGRPALIVEHHRFFKRGYDEAAHCVDFVNRIAPDIVWTDLEHVCESSWLTRQAPGGTQIRAYVATVRLRNSGSDARAFRVEKTGVPGDVKAVTVNGEPIAFTVGEHSVTCDVVLGAGAEGIVHFQHAPSRTPIDEAAPTLKTRLRVFARRRLSEVRDNYFDRSPLLTEIARAGKHLLPKV
jgi:hypothetical protein